MNSKEEISEAFDVFKMVLLTERYCSPEIEPYRISAALERSSNNFDKVEEDMGKYKFFIKEMNREDAYWFEDKVLKETDFQIGPIDLVLAPSKELTENNHFIIDDSIKQTEIFLNKEDATKLLIYLR